MRLFYSDFYLLCNLISKVNVYYQHLLESLIRRNADNAADWLARAARLATSTSDSAIIPLIALYGLLVSDMETFSLVHERNNNNDR